MPGSGSFGFHFVGEVAHIVAEKPDGPRGSSSMPLDARNTGDNLLLLCPVHHKIVDDDPGTYTVEHLIEVRRQHYAWIADRLQLEQPWKTKLHNFYYINVPRLNLLAAIAGISVNLSNFGRIDALHELGWDLNALMSQFKHLLERVELKAIDLEAAVKMGSSARGAVVGFDRELRTKNISMPANASGYAKPVSGDLNKDPHIYTKLDQARIVATIDRRWITTTTAFVQFRPPSGRGTFAGLAIVNSMDPVSNHMSITPLVIGLPSNPFLEEFYSGLARRTKQALSGL
ncbi:hypothetical protein [Xanthomonas citri]|uniref:hypothetical protein n=1 Tax=Xanthomonas citri TaxID=346 RepID=UPI001D17CFAE|nr:hypothetical protein [Xanthomonas citri]